MQSLRIENLLDIRKSISFSLFQKFKFPWEVLSEIKNYIVDLGNSLSQSEFIKKGADIWISKSANVSGNCFIKGPAIIDSNSEIRFGAFVRGSVIVGKNCVVGNSTELKNCILFDNVQTPHFNYVGDSILGFRSHIGAGVVLSNVKYDKSDVSIRINDQKIQTNLRKFGAILGDFVEIGCNSVLNPGTVIGRDSNVYPTSCVRGVIPENSIYKDKDNIVLKVTPGASGNIPKNFSI